MGVRRAQKKGFEPKLGARGCEGVVMKGFLEKVTSDLSQPAKE